MILANGTIYGSEEQGKLLADLENRINATRAGTPLPAETVIFALDQMAAKMEQGCFDELIAEPELREAVGFAAGMLHKDALLHRMQTELPALPAEIGRLQVRRVPLGTLLHIAAGNMDALPAFSVIEGLLTGNINLLKLPQADKGLTIRFFQELLAIEPELTNYIYVFDTPSSDLSGMQQLAACSDGIVVWGGDAAVSAIRQLASPGCKLIEWGHRLGFAYIAGNFAQTDAFEALAAHIVTTRQLLCSSCQVIYLDTEDRTEVMAFCERFLPLLEAAAAKLPPDIGAEAERSLRRYTAKLERLISGEVPQDRTVLQGEGCSVTACTDSALELSEMFGNVLVKPLPQAKLLPVLRQSKGYLQTAGLICPTEQREDLTELLIRAGVNRIMLPGEMSGTFPGEAHDGEYPLQRYTRIINILT